MAFTDSITKELGKRLEPGNIKTRQQAGQTLSYVEGWHVIAEANRIFGFDGWTREMLRLEETNRDEVGGKWRVGWMAVVQVTAHGVVRQGSGFGIGIAKSLGDAVESAIKEAETDAMKRALMTFGNPFGLALYDKSQAEVGNNPPERDPGADKLIEALTGFIQECETFDEAVAWWNEDTQKQARRDFGLTNEDIEPLKAAIQKLPRKEAA